MIHLELAKYGHKISNNLYPKPIHTLANADGGKKSHQYLMRYKLTPNIQKHKSKEFNNS